MSMQKVEKLYNRLNRSKKIHESTLLIERGTGDVLYVGEHQRTIDTPILVASITKLYTTAVILKLIETNQIQFNDGIVRYLDEQTLEGLHMYKDKDYSYTLTIDHLLTQRSGLPDYFLGSNGDSILSQVIEKDLRISFEDKINLTKQKQATFIPNSKKRAYYSDINFDLLGKIIENVTDKSLQENYSEHIFKPLNLQNTWLTDLHSNRSVPYSYYKNRRIERPLFIQSCEASGGIVSTTRELMAFIKAF